ncbi:MAG: hypothetical protein K2G37_04190 [Clostridia bacterium]|nr:hypothetical protein [Clostridia bacterium]MDE7329407.1 hypothetical protein [Clostridia bacterium]
MADNQENIQIQDTQTQVIIDKESINNLTNPSVEVISDTQNNIPEEIAQESEKIQAEQAQDTAEEQEEKTVDTPDEKEQAVYETEGWQAMVEEFFKTYPVAKGFATMIGEQIVSDAELCKDERCLEKALLRVFDKVYVPPKDLVRNQEFLETYVYKDDAIKNAIVERYLEELEKSRPPKAISSRGKITLTPPDKPKSIAEAGSLIKTMLKNRRI